MVMTATPIPRSLALTVYGDLDVSVIDELPPGRQPVSTQLIMPWERERVYDRIRRELNAGRQAFVITPLVQESDSNQEKAAVEEKERLSKEVFPDFHVGLMHGRLTPEEKEEVMTRFRDGVINILVSTSVVEVGVDIPNAAVMVIESAHRFGLAQLHQFRGRVGRGHDQAVCFLIPGSDEEKENERLQAMLKTNDGFQLAEIDLEQRGPGQFLGTRQSGYSDLKLANLTDIQLIEKARKYASEYYKKDPEFKNPKFAQLSEIVNGILGERSQTDIS
jgi:ATP-dependent DNA helicase RecG